ncbi:SLC13 family permease [Rothia halotolerans]|uniref:SLC13 family permease n=1 Tax=Rothia halotolerans TaxID=405770 RepID=UPI00101D6870|nr:SLC13 family permease [Rothia halotolerans]
MSVEVVTILVLAVMFLIGTIRNVNMGLLGLVAAFLVGLFAVGMDLEDVFAGFPLDLMFALMGLTFMFGFAQQNGTIDLVLSWSLRAVRGTVALAPWIFFALTGVLMGIGAIFAIGVVAPLAVPFARKYRINQLMMGMMVVHGGMAGMLSPLSVYGIYVNNFLIGQGLGASPWSLFLCALVFNIVIGAVVYLAMGGRSLIGRRVTDAGEASLALAGAGGAAAEGSEGAAAVRSPEGASASRGSGGASPAGESARPGEDLGDEGPAGGSATGNGASSEASPVTAAVTSGARVTPYQLLTLAGLAVLVVGAGGFGVDIGVLSIIIGTVLAVVKPAEARKSMVNISWGTVVLVGGVVTYINVLETAGTVDFVSGGVVSIGSAMLGALLLCYMAGIVSALASSIATIGVGLSIAAPLLQTGELPAVGFAAAIAIASTVVDVSPFSTNGAMVLANVDASERDRYFKQMLIYSGVIVVAGPALAWLFVLLPF